MANFFKNLIQYMLVSYLVLTLFTGIQVPDSGLYFLASLAIISIGMLLVSPILKFLTVKENFITTFILSSLICIGMFYLLDAFMTGFFIESSTFKGIELNNIVVNDFEMTPVLTIISASITASFLGSLLFVLEKSS